MGVIRLSNTNRTLRGSDSSASRFLPRWDDSASPIGASNLNKQGEANILYFRAQSLSLTVASGTYGPDHRGHGWSCRLASTQSNHSFVQVPLPVNSSTVAFVIQPDIRARSGELEAPATCNTNKARPRKWRQLQKTAGKYNVSKNAAQSSRTACLPPAGRPDT